MTQAPHGLKYLVQQINRENKPMRDSQRSKVYKAERDVHAWKWSRRHESLDEAKAFIKGVLSHPSIVKKYSPNTHMPKVHDGRGRKSAAANAGEMWLPKWSRNEMVMLHELAHVLSKRKLEKFTFVTSSSPSSGGQATGYKRVTIAGHGWEFCEVYLDLVRVVLGNAAAEELKQSFTKHRVRFRPKKAMTPERLAQLQEQGRRLAAARRKDGQNRATTVGEI